MNVINYLHTYLIPQLLDSIPRSVHNTKAIRYLKESILELFKDLPIKLRSGHPLYGRNCIIRNCGFHRGICRNVRRRWINGFQLYRFRFVKKKKWFVFLRRRRECRTHSIRRRSRSPTFVPSSFADIVSFLSQECAIDRVRPLHDHSRLTAN